MRQLVTIIICFTIGVSVHAQMETDGDNPEPVYKKFPYEFQYATCVKFVRGDMGWFDDYVNDFYIDHTGRMWIAGNHGLSYSDNKGLKWHLSTSRYATFAIFETRKHTMLSSSNNEFLMRSENRGQTWNNQKVKDVGTGKSSHGERYDDIFYVQVDDKRILRTCQYNSTILISDDDGISWKKSEAPDSPESIVNLGDSLLVMFTYDEMYTSTDRGKSWKLQSKGLPAKRDAEPGGHQGVIDCGVATVDGTVMALVESQEEDVYEHVAYYFNIKTRKWLRDETNRIYEWSQSSIHDGGDGRLLIYDYRSYELTVSFDKGKSWDVAHTMNHNWASPDHFRSDGKNIYFLSYAGVYVLHLPVKCADQTLPEIRTTFLPDEAGLEKIEFFPVKKVIDEDEEFSVFQLCAPNGEGYARFMIHVPNDTALSEVNILKREVEGTSIEQTFTTEIPLAAGDYELWYYNTGLSGCYFLNVVLINGAMEQETGTNCIFYK